jgi:hypothetical protein
MNDALENLSSVLQRLTRSYLLQQVDIYSDAAWPQIQAPSDTSDSRLLLGALLDVLIAECERRGLTDPIIDKARELARRLRKPTEPKVQ